MKIEQSGIVKFRHREKQSFSGKSAFGDILAQKTTPASRSSLQTPDSLVGGRLPYWKQDPITPVSRSRLQAKHGTFHVTRGARTSLTHRMHHYIPLINRVALKYNVHPSLVAGIIQQESGFNSRVVSHAGAMGMMQLMPATARDMGVRNPFDPAQNIEGGVKYLRQMLDRYGGRIDLALAAYNAGPGNVEKYGFRIPPFAETRNYVVAVARHSVAIYSSGLMRSPVSAFFS